MGDGLELRGRLGSETFGVGVVPTGQGRGRNAEEVGGILDVGEADELGGLLEEAFGGVGIGSEGGVVGSKVTVAVLTVELGGSDDELD